MNWVCKGSFYSFSLKIRLALAYFLAFSYFMHQKMNKSFFNLISLFLSFFAKKSKKACMINKLEEKEYSHYRRLRGRLRRFREIQICRRLLPNA